MGKIVVVGGVDVVAMDGTIGGKGVVVLISLTATEQQIMVTWSSKLV